MRIASLTTLFTLSVILAGCAEQKGAATRDDQAACCAKSCAGETATASPKADASQKTEATCPMAQAACPKAQGTCPKTCPCGGKLLKHVVMFKFKEGTTPEQTKAIIDSFRGLTKEIPTIKSFEWGTNNSPEKHSDGLTHVFVLTFASEADRDAYLPHPAHKAFGKLLGPHLDKVTVVDYWNQP